MASVSAKNPGKENKVKASGGKKPETSRQEQKVDKGRLPLKTAKGGTGNYSTAEEFCSQKPQRVEVKRDDQEKGLDPEA
ncbi:hypothetical protein D9613_004545 [Agrocybe pediades]|uniref:Uncharacterized protein n=1 Tax=Agrocybe pediades TaxID=84607 RepID=A0A8H4VLE9_9AGAR|nr:hypothetical protein D9613_004545 [Agrocybe pediades]